jgi:hypothetical protein
MGYPDPSSGMSCWLKIAQDEKKINKILRCDPEHLHNWLILNRRSGVLAGFYSRRQKYQPVFPDGLLHPAGEDRSRAHYSAAQSEIYPIYGLTDGRHR